MEEEDQVEERERGSKEQLCDSQAAQVRSCPRQFHGPPRTQAARLILLEETWSTMSDEAGDLSGEDYRDVLRIKELVTICPFEIFLKTLLSPD